MTTPQSPLEKLKQHWFISLVLLCAAVAGATWKVAHELLIAPRDSQIARLTSERSELKEEVEKLRDSIQKLQAEALSQRASASAQSNVAFARDGVFEGSSVTTNDGRCTVRVDRVGEGSVSISVTIGTQSPATFEDRPVGSRVSVAGGTATYLIDLHRIRGNIVDLSIHREQS